MAGYSGLARRPGVQGSAGHEGHDVLPQEGVAQHSMRGTASVACSRRTLCVSEAESLGEWFVESV